MQRTCKNCGESTNGKYCANCGQKVDIHDISFSHILHELVHAFTHADKNFLSFLKKLVVSPATLAYEYLVEGKRQRYFNPFTFFLLITAINAFIESKVLSLKENIFHDNNEYAHLFNVYNKLMLLVIIPVTALVIYWFYHGKSRRKYAEYLVYAMLLISMKTVIDTFVNIGNYIVVYGWHVYKSVDEHLLYISVMIALFANMNYRYHKRFGDRSLLKAIFSSLLIVAGLSLIYIFIIWAFLRNFQGLGNFSLYGIKISG